MERELLEKLSPEFNVNNKVERELTKDPTQRKSHYQIAKDNGITRTRVYWIGRSLREDKPLPRGRRRD